MVFKCTKFNSKEDIKDKFMTKDTKILDVCIILYPNIKQLFIKFWNPKRY